MSRRIEPDRPPQLIGEVWKAVPEWFGLQVSNLGRVWRPAYYNARGVFWPAKLRKPNYMKDAGYCTTISSNNVSKVSAVSRLMLTAFDRPPVEGEVARHLDDNNRRNVLENLAWGFPKDNSADAVRNNRSPRGERQGLAVLTDEQVKLLRSLHKKGKAGHGAPALAKRFGLNSNTVQTVLYGGTWRHVK